GIRVFHVTGVQTCALPISPLLEYFEGDHPISGKVLVPGCGSGNDARFLASRGCDVVGLDISHIALQRAETYAPPRNGTLSYLLGDRKSVVKGTTAERSGGR